MNKSICGANCADCGFGKTITVKVVPNQKVVLLEKSVYLQVHKIRWNRKV